MCAIFLSDLFLVTSFSLRHLKRLHLLEFNHKCRYLF